MPLNRFVHEFLLKLERASGDGRQWVDEAELGDIPADDRQIAVAAGWVKERGFGNLRAYKILPAGYTALGQNADDLMRYLHADLNGGAPIDPEISVSLYGENLGIDEPVALCIEGCGQPRYRHFTRCEKHQKAYWRNAKSRASWQGVFKKPPIADDDTTPEIPVVVEAPEPDYEAFRARQEREHWANLEEQEADAELQQWIDDNGDYPPGHPFNTSCGLLPSNSSSDDVMGGVIAPASPLTHLVAATLVRGLVLLWKVKGR